MNGGVKVPVVEYHLKCTQDIELSTIKASWKKKNKNKIWGIDSRKKQKHACRKLRSDEAYVVPHIGDVMAKHL